RSRPTAVPAVTTRSHRACRTWWRGRSRAAWTTGGTGTPGAGAPGSGADRSGEAAGAPVGCAVRSCGPRRSAGVAGRRGGPAGRRGGRGPVRGQQAQRVPQLLVPLRLRRHAGRAPPVVPEHAVRGPGGRSRVPVAGGRSHPVRVGAHQGEDLP